MKKIYKIFFLMTVALLSAVSVHVVHAAKLTAEVDRTNIGIDETLQLTVSLDEQVNFSAPDFKVLEQDFEILNQSRSNQFRTFNGRAEALTQWSFVLAPKREGQIAIPPLNYGNAHSSSIGITVRPANQPLDGEIPELFIETKVDKDVAYVQEQILLSYNIHIAQSAGNLREIAVEELQLPDAVIELVSENSFRRHLQGQSYYVKEVVYAIYPQQSTQLNIPSLLFSLSLSSGNRAWNSPFGNSRGDLRRLRSDAVTINVQAKPSEFTFSEWLPASDVTLEEEWSNKPESFRVGEPITRTITLKAEGLTAAQIPPLPDQSSSGFKVYADQPQQDDEKSARGITGRRIESVAIVPATNGKLTLPEVAVGWWDTTTQQQRVARLPAREINVAAAAISSINLAPPELAGDNSQSSEPGVGDILSLAQSPLWPWILATAVCAGFAVVFFVAWLRARKRVYVPADPVARQHAISVKEALNVVRRACAENDAMTARKALITWAQLYWNDSHITRLQAIIERSQHAGLARELELLDKFLYRTSSHGNASNGNKKESSRWPGDALWKVLYHFQKRQQQEKIREGTLAPLYPA